MKRVTGKSIMIGVLLWGVGLVGSARAQTCSVSPMSLDFGNVCVGSSADRTFTVTNTAPPIGCLGFTITAFNRSNPAFTVISPSPPVTLCSGSSVTVTVRLTCTSLGPQSGIISIVTNPPNLCSAVSVSGVCIQPICAVSPTSINFGNVCVGDTADRTFMVSNSGNTSFTINSINPSNPAFTIIGPGLPATVFPGASVIVTVRLTCSSAGARSGTISITTSSACGAVSCASVSVSGTCVQPSTCTVNPTTLNFGNICVGSSANQSFTVTNSGGPVTINAINSSNSAFTIVSPALPATVAAGGSVAMTVRLTCASPGSQSGTLSFNTSSACGAVSCAPVTVSGTCIQAVCGVSSTSLDFGNVCVGASADQSFTVSNTGNVSFTINSINSSNPAFTIVSPALPAIVPAGGSELVTVRLSCTTPGAQSGTLSLTASSQCGPVACATVNVIGFCAQITCAVNPTNLDFGQIFVGANADHSFMVSNSGNRPLTMTAINSNDPAFSVVGPGLPVMVPAGSSVAVTVRLSCTTPGAQSGTLSLTTSSQCGPVTCSTVNVTGFCALLACETMEPVIDFGMVPLSSNPTAIAVATNMGNVPFTVVAVMLTNPARFTLVNTSQSLPAVINPGESLTARIRYICTSPTPTGVQETGQLIFVTDPNANCSPVELRGTCAGVVNQCQGIPVPSETGCTVTDPQTGSEVEVPPHTLKADAMIGVIALDSLSPSEKIDGDCGVTIQPGESFPDVPGFVRVTHIVRYEVQPCETRAFGPGTRITLSVDQSVFPRGLPVGSPSLRLFELARSGGRLVFLDTGIRARVLPGGRVSLFGDFVTIPDIQAFGTFAVFMPTGNASRLSPDWSEPGTGEQPLAATQQTADQRLYFPVISQRTGRQTRISIANPEPARNLSVRFTAYTETGVLVGTQVRTVMGNRQESFLVARLFPGFTSGAIMAEPQGGGGMTGFYEIADNFAAPLMLAGAEGVQTPQRALVFPVIKSSGGGSTEVRVFNPNSAPVSLRLVGFTAAGNPVNPTNSAGQSLGAITLPAFGTGVISSSDSSSPYDVRLPFSNLDGGHLVVQATDGRLVVGGEVVGEMLGGRTTLAVLNGLAFPAGCLASTMDSFGCHVDDSPESPVPSSVRQYTLYAPYVEGPPAEPVLYLVNVSDRPARLAVSAFSEVGQFLATFPPNDFVMIRPHEVFQAPVISLFGFNPSPGYVRVEDPDSSLVGGTINRASGRYMTAVPIIPDDPRLTQTATNTFFSRLQLDPASANPQQMTGLLSFNPTNNNIQFRITITDANGLSRQQIQTLVARGTHVRVRQSLGALFGNISISSGYVQVDATCEPDLGMGGRVIPVAVYRSSSVISIVPQQNRPP